MKSLITAIILLLCTIGPIVAVVLYEKSRRQGITAEILVRAPEHGNFYPRKLVLPVGETARLKLRNVDVVMHGFAIPAAGIDAGPLKPGHQVIIEFTPEKVGMYDFYCTAWCSEHHLQMRGVIEVVAK